MEDNTSSQHFASDEDVQMHEIEQHADCMDEQIEGDSTVAWDHFNHAVSSIHKHDDLLANLLQTRLKHVPFGDEHMPPSSVKFDIDGLCLVGHPGMLLSFIKNPLQIDEDLTVVTNPRHCARFFKGTSPLHRLSCITLSNAADRSAHFQLWYLKVQVWLRQDVC